MGAPVSAPVQYRFDPDPHLRPDRAPPPSGRASSGVSSLVIRSSRAVARAPSRRGPAGLHRTDPRPAAGDPARPRGPRRARRRPDRDRQDGRLRAADAPAPPRVTAGRPPRHPRADPHPDPRARAPGRGERPDLRFPGPHPLDDHLRRRRVRPAGPRAARRARDRGRDPRPPARPRRAADDRPVTGRDPRPRRGRPDARHGLHPRHPQDPRDPAVAPPEPALLGHLLGRDPAAGRRPARQPGVGPGHAAQHADRAGHPCRPHGRPRPQARAAEPSHPERPDRPGARLHADQARRKSTRAAADPGRHHRDRDPRQQEPAAARPRAGRLQGRPVHGPGRDRGRRPRARHRGAPARRQLRAADGPRGLRPSHRTDRPCRRRRRCRLAGLRRRAQAAQRHRASARTRDPARDDPGLRARSAHPAGADPAGRSRWFAAGLAPGWGSAPTWRCPSRRWRRLRRWSATIVARAPSVRRSSRGR